MKKNRQIQAFFLAAALTASTLPGGAALAAAPDDSAIHYLTREQLAPGVVYSEEDHVSFGGCTVTGPNLTYEPHRVRMNHLSIDPGADGVRISSARAEDTVNARENIREMAERETAKGNNVVAAINADPYDMDYGINCGIQVQNGDIIISEPTVGYTTNTAPAFFVDDSGAHIDALRTVIDVTAEGYAAAVTTLNRNSFGSWYEDPAKLTSDTLRLYTSNITSDNTMTHYRTETNPIPGEHAFALLRLRDFSGALHAGTTYTGTVQEVFENDGFSIPEDCVVLAGYAGDTAGVAALTAGEEVTVTGNLYTGSYTTDQDGRIEERGDLADSVTTAVNGYHLLAKDGVISTGMVENGGTDLNARTVIGITADGKVEILCANKPGSPKIDASLTTGACFKEIAEYMMGTLNCVDVLNMDGGGSTEMVARRAGSEALSTVSYPSDNGTSRIVSNSLLVISDAARTSEVGQVVVDSDITIYQGSRYGFSCRLTDQSGSAMSSDGYSLVWQAEKGSIAQNGAYTAPAESGMDTVKATVNGVSGTAQIQVVGADAIASVGLSDMGTVALKQGDSHPFALAARTSTGTAIIIDPALAEWTLSGDIGTLDENGILTVTASTGEGTVTCRFLDQTYTAAVVIGLDEQIIDDFEGGAHRACGYESSSKYIYPKHPVYWGGDTESAMIGVETDPSKVKSGEQSLYLVYDTTDWPMTPSGARATNGTLSVYPFWDDTSAGYGQGDSWTEEDRAALQEQYTAKAMPRKFGLWVYSGDEDGDGVSDNYDCMSTFTFKVGPSQKNASIKITPTEHMDWVGWKWLEFDIPESWSMPITFNYFMVSNINKALPISQNYRTTLMFDDLKYIYTDTAQDNDGPVFSNTAPDAGGIYKNQFTFTTTITDAASSVDPNAISVTVNGKKFTDYTYDSATGVLSFAKTGLTDQEVLRVIVKARDTKGNESVPYIDRTYTVDLAEDITPPVISNVTPTRKAVVRIPSPRIGFRLTDTKSGVDPDSVTVTLDGKAVPVYYDASTGWGYAQPDFSLESGDFSLTVMAADKSGNAMEAYSDTLTLQPIAQPRDPDNFAISVVPDTQGNAYTEKIYQRVQVQDTDFVLHLGDIVDGVGENEYVAGKNYLDGIGKPYLTIPGNHEGGAGNLNYYMEYFGSPTYTFDYGCTRLIALNAAYNQSISATDSTQYHYLEEMLAGSAAKNIVVYDHVVTRDHYSTEHNMTAEEAEQFESILTAYKAAHPDVTVTVLFGHLHTLDSWEVGSVQYIIGGNAAGKGYVTADEGNLLGSGILKVSGGRAQYVYEPMPTKVYIKNEAMTGSRMTAVEGASVPLNLYGDFREAAAVSSASVNYVTRIDDDELVNIQWTSSAPEVASVDQNGVVTVHASAGQAVVTATCGGKTSSVTIQAADQGNLQVSKLELSVPEGIRQGDTFQVTVVATDPYGSKVALKLSGSMLRAEPASAVTIHEDGSLTANSGGNVTLTAAVGSKTVQAVARVSERYSESSSDSDIYSIHCETDEAGNGTVTVNKSSASEGAVVLVTVIPDSGCVLDTLTVTGAGGRKIPVSPNPDGTWSFRMPGSRVTVTAAFRANEPDWQNPFTDVDENNMFFGAIASAVQRGLFNGTSATTFSPDVTMSREMLWMVLGRLSGQSPADMQAARAWAMERGITDGSNPQAPASRQQMVTILWRLAGSPEPSGTLEAYSDADSVADYARSAMAWAVENGILNGANGVLMPDSPATRGQAAAFILRYSQSTEK